MCFFQVKFDNSSAHIKYSTDCEDTDLMKRRMKLVKHSIIELCRSNYEDIMYTTPSVKSDKCAVNVHNARREKTELDYCYS